MAGRPSDAREPLQVMRRAVVKVMAVSDPPDYDQPWQTLGVTNASGSGVIIATKAGPRVLTNGHVVENQVFVEVRRFGRAHKYEATVEGVGHECDLALLKVPDAGFFKGTKPMPIGELPALGDRVSVLGFPIGGDRLSVTEGVVSRIEMLDYAQSQRSLLGIQIDAAINAGNSGGPVMMDGRMVGVAFQALEEAENIGYVIAAPVVEHFLEDLADGSLDGFPDLGIVTQNLESEAHRRSLGLAKSRRGILVNRVAFEGSAWRVLRPGDVLLRIDDTAVATDGTVPFQRGSRIDHAYLVSQRQVGAVVPLDIWRDGKSLVRRVRLKAPQHLVSDDTYDRKPTYYLYAGLVLVPLTREYLQTWGDDWYEHAPGALLNIYEKGIRTPGRREIVVLQKVLADRVNRGYHDFESTVISRVQGTRIRSMHHLIELIESSSDPFVRLETQDHEEIVIDRELASTRQDAILRRYGVPSDRSPDLALLSE